MLFSYSYGQQQIGDNKLCRRIAGNFDCHKDVAVQRGVHWSIEHVQGFGRVPASYRPGGRHGRQIH